MPVIGARFCLHVQGGKTSGGVKRLDAGTQFVPLQRLSGFLHDQGAEDLSIVAGDAAKLNRSNDMALVLT